MEPMRLQKWLAYCGFGSRRYCETLIQQGRITVNGEPATLGIKVDPEHDTILLDGKPIKLPSQRVYLMLNKPRGYVTTLRDPHASKTIMALLKEVPVPVYPVGRLDADSEGLILLTNDGELTNRLLHPRHKVPKTYHVWVHGVPSAHALSTLRKGVVLEEGITAPAKVRLREASPTGSLLEITIREGRKRQIRRMCQAVGHPVQRLVRVAFGPLRLPADLAPGQWRWLTPEEINALKTATQRARKLSPRIK